MKSGPKPGGRGSWTSPEERDGTLEMMLLMRKDAQQDAEPDRTSSLGMERRERWRENGRGKHVNGKCFYR